MHNTQQTQEMNIQALSGIRTGNLKRPQAYALYSRATGIGRLIRVANQEDIQCISINPVKISTGKFYDVRIYDLNMRRPAVEGDLFQFLRMIFFLTGNKVAPKNVYTLYSSISCIEYFHCYTVQ